jgi:hypothetical protein
MFALYTTYFATTDRITPRARSRGKEQDFLCGDDGGIEGFRRSW